MKFNCNYQIFIYIIFSINIFSSFSLKYPQSLYLNNGNIFVIHETGITIYDHLFMNIIKDVFIFSDKINLGDISRITTVVEDEYIFCIIKDKIYIANDKGDILFHNKTSFLKDGIYPKYYSLVVIKDETKNLYKYVINYLYHETLYHSYFQYNITSNENNFIGDYTHISCSAISTISYDLSCLFADSNALTCQYMINKDNVTSIVCFLLSNSGSLSRTNRLEGYFYFVTDNGFSYNSSIPDFSNSYNDIECIKSFPNPNHNKALISLYSSSGEMKSFIFDIDSYKYIKIIQNFNYNTCRKSYYSLYVNYYKYNSEYINSCLDPDGNLLIEFYNEDLKNTNNLIIDNSNINNAFSILYSNCTQKYYLVSENNKFKSLIEDDEELDDLTIEKCLGITKQNADDSDNSISTAVIIIIILLCLVVLGVIGFWLIKKYKMAKYKSIETLSGDEHPAPLFDKPVKNKN